jgi:CDP-diacylglycerol--glycerol-3-phosphate 3-phosphatidyltransferase
MRSRSEVITIPNTLSVSRIVFLPVLAALMLADLRMAFLVLYILVGATDSLDGMIARRFDMKTELGKTIDSVADLFFFLGSLVFIYYLFPEIIESNWNLLLLFYVMFSLSFLVSWMRLGKPIVMHTQLLRLNGVLVYLVVILSFFMLERTIFLASVVLVIYFFAFAEEILIFLCYGDVDRDTKSIFHLMASRRGA